MSPSAFLDLGSPPGDRELQSVLGKAMVPWAEVRSRLASKYAPLGEKWSFSGKAHGWLLRLDRKKKTVGYVVPCQGYFVASFALSEKNCEAAERGGLAKSVLDVVRRAPRFAEDRNVRIEVRARNDLAAVEALASIKMAD